VKIALTMNRLLTAAVLLSTLTISAAQKTDDIPLAEAKECRERGGLPNFFAKLQRGAEVRIGYLGGSITAQAGWRPKALAWFQKEFPGAKISEINAAIGGTGSDLGVFRLRRDVLDKKPDLLFVEFAVNDGGAPPSQICRTMEGIVRQTWRNDPATDICFVYTLVADMAPTLQRGRFPRAASAMERVADHYHIPSIHMGIEVARLAGEGKLVMKADPKTPEEKAALADKIIFSADGVHPHPETGHKLYLEAIVRSMAAIRAVGKPGPHELKAPLVADNWEAAKIVAVTPKMLSAGWHKLDPTKDTLAKQFGNRMPDLWRAAAPGETLTFKFKGTGAAVYDIVGPDVGQVEVTLDGQPPRRIARFDPYCNSYRLQKLTIATDLPDANHTVKIAVSAEPPDKAAILAKRSQKIDDPKRYADNAFYPGALLLVGDLVE
jgi:lysophospholipase L1-like esterase